MSALVTLTPGADALLTADRDEVKYLLPAVAAAELTGALTARLPRHRPDQLITTVYFDTPHRHQFRWQAQGASTKLRARSYGPAHPRPVLWLELKHKQGIRTGKRRLAIPGQQIAHLFGPGLMTPDTIRRWRGRLGPWAAPLVDEVTRYCAGLPEPLAADCLVNFRRVAWQDAPGRLRLTLDLDLAFFRPPPDLWSGQSWRRRGYLGAPAGREVSGLIEVKSRGAPPPWLEGVLAACGARAAAYSKFEAASRAVHG